VVLGSAVCPQYLRDLAYLGKDHQVYDKLGAMCNETSGKCMVDFAFGKVNQPFLIKLSQDYLVSTMPTHQEQRLDLQWKQKATSMRQAVEWGMPANRRHGEHVVIELKRALSIKYGDTSIHLGKSTHRSADSIIIFRILFCICHALRKYLDLSGKICHHCGNNNSIHFICFAKASTVKVIIC